jgi:hypothetical protein
MCQGSTRSCGRPGFEVVALSRDERKNFANYLELTAAAKMAILERIQKLTLVPGAEVDRCVEDIKACLRVADLLRRSSD